MKKNNQFFAVSLMILLLATVLSACGGGKADKNMEEAPKENGISSESTASGGSEDKAQYGGTVVVGITQDLDSLDPHKAVAAGTKEVLFNVFEGLVKPDKAGDLVPAVASGYEISEDGKVYTFTLREGIKFHNGALVTVDDIIYSIKRCAGLLDTTDEEVVLEPALSNISEVKKVGETKVEILLKEGDTEILGYLTCAVIPKDYYKQDTAPVGTGPFRFVSYAPLESFLAEKNQEYWEEGVPYLDQVTFKISSNTDSAFLELKAGAIDLFPYLTNDQAIQLSSDFEILEGHMNLVQGLFLNNGQEPFDNLKVRQALNYAVDKQQILDMLGGGRGSIIGSNMFPGFEKYYNADMETYFTRDIAKAKELLAEAGYAEGLTFTITVPSNYQYHVDTAQILVEQLKEAGIAAKIQQIDWSQWLSEVYGDRNYQATIVGLDAKLAPRDVMERYQSKAYNNFVNFSNPQYDTVTAQALAAIDDGVKIEKYKELQSILAKDAASVYIQDPALLVAMNKKLAGYEFYPVFVMDMAKVYFKK